MERTSTVLIVDDERFWQVTLEKLLAEEGYQLAFAKDGPEALTLAAQLTPDVILLDVMMPSLNGFEVCRRLRATPGLAEVPILIVTSLNDPEAKLQGLQAGADDFITKPYDPVELQTRVRTITQLNRYRRLLAERARFTWVVEYSDDGYVMVDADDRILYANPQARLYLGLPSGDSTLTARTFLAQARQQYQPEPPEAWANWPRPRAPQYLVRPETSTAQAFWLEVNTLALPATDAARQVIRLRDVTASMSVQRDIWKFHAALSHKLRTPINLLYLSLGVLTERAARLRDAQIAQLSRTALEEVKRLGGEVQDILQYLNAPTLAQNGSGFPLARLAQVVEAISADLDLPAVTTRLAADLAPARLALTPEAVELMLWETLENSRKFHPAHAPNITIDVARGDTAHVLCQIRDDGLTLSPEQLSRALTPYYQAEKHLTGEVPGMGLGLALVAALVWSAGGACRLLNRDDAPGVMVELLLPLA